MASFLLPSSIQKRLLRYALSRLELLDTDALDLEHLEISWGTQTKLEFRDVGVRLKKLAHLLQLPSNIDLTKAQVLLLRITIPVDIYSSPIVVEVDGVKGHVKILPETDYGSKAKYSSTSKKRQKGSGEKSKWAPTDDIEDAEPAIPTAVDLAQSFLQTEPPEERAELEAAIMSQSEFGSSSIASDEGDDESVVGTGTALSLPGFIANFLKGIVDRLQVRVHGITMNVEVDLPNDASSGTGEPLSDLVTLQMKIEDIDIEGVTFDTKDGQSPIDGQAKVPSLGLKDGKRLISLRNLRGSLISDAGIFASLARSSALSSLSATHSNLFEHANSQSKRSFTTRSSSGKFDDEPRSTTGSYSDSRPSTALDDPPSLSASGEAPLIDSTVASDSGRFDDAPEDEGLLRRHEEVGMESRIELGNGQISDSAILDNLGDSQFLDHEDEDDDENFPFSFSSSQHQSGPRISANSTPRGSLYMPSGLHPHIGKYAKHDPLSATTRTWSQPTRLPARSHPTLSQDPLTQSEPFHTPKEEAAVKPSLARQDSAADSDAGSSSTSVDENLAESQYFTHEDAESMYMSALSQGSISNRMPGAWDAPPTIDTKEPTVPLKDSTGSRNSRPASPDNLEYAAIALSRADIEVANDNIHLSELSESLESLPYQSQQSSVHSIIPPEKPIEEYMASNRHTTSNLSEQSTASEDYSKVAKPLFSLDQCGIYLPPTAEVSNAEDTHPMVASTTYGSHADPRSSMSQSTLPHIPGRFSSPTIRARVPSSVLEPPLRKQNPVDEKKETENTAIEVVLGQFYAQFDVSVARLLTKLIQIISSALTINKPESNPAQGGSSKDENSTSPLAVKVSAHRISLKFLERLPGMPLSKLSLVDTWVKPPISDVLLRTTLKGLDINIDITQAVTTAAITLQKFVFGYAKENIVSFDADLAMKASVRDLAAAAGVDISVNVIKTATSTRFKVSTLPIHVSIDLQRLDETFSWFGGLSSVLNMTSSMGSNTTMTASPPSKPKPKGVRFEAPIKPDDQSVASQNKVDARIGGFVLDLVGKDCSVGVDTTAVKIVSREQGIGLAIDQIKISGPHLSHAHDEPAIRAEIIGTRLEYLTTPENRDLDRLLALITPSKAKYDQDDDILLDTLLRQRRQGAVVRITIDQFRTQVSRLEQLQYLPGLGEEVSRLATVAKYLPEDDRPGLLSLILVRDVDFNVNVDHTIGKFRLRASDIEVAQITFPSLVALSVSTIAIHRNETEEMLCSAMKVEQYDAKTRSPMIMARMIGDEMEPVVKVKLWNVGVEYRVPTLMTFLGLTETASTEDMATSIAASMATLTDRKRVAIPSAKDKGKGSKSQDSRALMVDIALRDCIIGLNPLGQPSKILVVMTEAHISATLPKDNNTSATAEMGKGSILVIDNVANILTSGGVARLRRRSFDGGSHQVQELCTAGFVSVGYIASAKANVRVSTADDLADKCIDVELRNELFVLECCADSTQTLIAALGALAPPTPPSKEVKYRTKVMPMSDLLSSLTEHTFETPEDDYDFDGEFGHDMSHGTEVDEDSNLDFDSQYYQKGETMGSFHHGSAASGSRLGSLLFDEHDGPDIEDGVLLESFSSKQHVHIDEELNFQEDHFGSGSILEGTAHQWNSAKNTYDKSNEHKVRESPLKVWVRDVNIIWNLFDGYDWQHTRDTITNAVREVESKAIAKQSRGDRRPSFEMDFEEEETVIGDFLFNSIYIGIPANRDPRELAEQINQELNDNATETESIATTQVSGTTARQGSHTQRKGRRLRLNRSKHHKITFELKGVNVDLVAFPPGSGETQSSIDIRVRDFDIFDHVPTSTWKKFATYMHDAGEREAGTSQIHIELLNVRPVPDLAASEMVIKATVLPLRLHVDQDALDFITRFFEFKDDSSLGSTSQGDVPFLQRVEVNSIQVKLDFKPKRVDYAGIRSGHTTEFMNFIVLDEANMVLRHTIIYGISGFDRLGKCLNDIWMPDVKRNQLPGILAGLAPVRSIANVGSGVRDLVVIPMREYKKDGRIVRSIGKGAAAFARTTGTELIKLGAKLAVGTQTVLQGAEEFLVKQRDSHDDWSDDSLDEEDKKQISLYADQPIGVVQGLRGAYASLERDLSLARDAIIAVPAEVMESGTAQGAAKAVLKRAPTVILRPVIGASKAIGQTLMGATNSLDPQNRRRVEDKYKRF